MIVFCNANGTVTSVLPTPVYQGSALSGGLYFLAPVPKTNSVTVAFELADGTVTDSYLLTPVIQGLENIVDTLGETYSVWEWQTKDKRITEQPGVVTAQFSIGHFSGEEGNSEFQGQTTAAVTFTVQKGVAPLPTETPSADQWDTLIALYSEIKGTLDKIDNIDGKVTTVTIAANATESYAQKAHDSESAAATSESNALTYKTAAETAKDTATAKAQEASESATAAATSATEAQSAANTATEKAAEATQAAENATAVTEQAINARIVQTTGQSTDKIMSQKAVTNAVKGTKNNIADLKEALYGYVLDTAEVETDSVIPSTVEVGGNTYNLVDGVRGLVKEIKGGTVNSDGLKSVEYTGLNIYSKESSLTANILPFTTTLRGVYTYKDRIIITKNESDDYYTATKETNISEQMTVDGSESWIAAATVTEGKPRFALEIGNYFREVYKKLTVSNWIDASAGATYNCSNGVSKDANNILIYIDGITTVEGFKTWLASNPITLVYVLGTPTTEVLSTTLTESDVMPLLELGGSVEIINENSLYVTGSTALEMVYKLINNTTTSEVSE